MLQDEYYVIERENNDNYPLFAWDQPENEYNLGKPVEWREPLKFRLGQPVPRKPEWVDYHELPNPVISKAFLEALLPLDLYGAQYVPAKVRNQEKRLSKPRDYWLLHIWNRIECLDREKSELELLPSGRIFSIHRLVLDEKALGRVEPERRMIFGVAEKTTVSLVHERVKEAIESVEPKGVRFFKASEWNSDIIFEK